ncbi:MAG: hypothetical protein JWO37_4059 [Acidimicrobiales bacterium]|jgi:hypothetical protein|nr:hypothetical protein [Acidimicrobiales bacterium]
MILPFAALVAVVAVAVAAISFRARGSARRRHSEAIVGASEVSTWMSEVMDAMNPEPPTLHAVHDDQAVPTGPPSRVTILMPDDQHPAGHVAN